MGATWFHKVTSLPNSREISDLVRWEKDFVACVKDEKENEFIPYYLAILAIRKTLLDPNTNLSMLTKDYIGNCLLPVIKTLIKYLDDYRGGDETANSVLRNLRKVWVALENAYSVFNKEKKRNAELVVAEEELSKALKYWYKIGATLRVEHPELFDYME